MAGTLVRRHLDQPLDEAVAVAGHEPDAGDDSLLQVAVGEEVQGEGVGVLAEARVFLKLEGRGHAAQAVHLVEHLRAGRLGGLAKRRIDSLEVVDTALGQSEEASGSKMLYQ